MGLDFDIAGLGLDYHELRLVRATEDWVAVGGALRDRIAHVLEGDAAHMAEIGSSSVAGLLAKPIIDLAVGLDELRNLGRVRAKLEAEEWIYRGDAGGDGGHVFVLEDQPWHRVAHLHVVEHGGTQWSNYLRLRDLLGRSPTARAQYEAVKLRLIEEVGNDRKAYTEGKTEVVHALLSTFA